MPGLPWGGGQRSQRPEPPQLWPGGSHPPTSCPVGSNTAVKHSGLLFFGGVSFGLQGWFFFFSFHFNEPSIWKISSQSHATNTKLEPSVQIKQLGAFVPLRAEMYGSFRLRGPTLSLNSFFFPLTQKKPQSARRKQEGTRCFK